MLLLPLDRRGATAVGPGVARRWAWAARTVMAIAAAAGGARGGGQNVITWDRWSTMSYPDIKRKPKMRDHPENNIRRLFYNELSHFYKTNRNDPMVDTHIVV